jgi:hypothetical protein
MRTILSVLLVGALGVSGCFWNESSQPPGKTAASATTKSAKPAKPATAKPAVKSKSSGKDQKPLVTPETALPGKVVLVNAVGRFVVLNFPVGHLPPVDQHLSLLRRGVKVGEVKITNQQLDDNIVADLILGEAEAGDEARSQ